MKAKSRKFESREDAKRKKKGDLQPPLSRSKEKREPAPQSFTENMLRRDTMTFAENSNVLE